MEDLLTEWLLENRPYTKLNTRIKHFIQYCRTLEPGLSYSYLRYYIIGLADELMKKDLGRLWNRDRCFERVLRLYGVNDQRTEAWHLKRNEMITASEVYKIFGTPEARREVMLRKLVPAEPSSGNPVSALIWGTRFEPVAKKIYEQKTNCTIIDVSCVQHPTYSFLGASPDGLIVPKGDDEQRYGRLVEFKCPMSRAPKDEIPPAYIHQMQMQMECTGIDECEYVEFRFKQMMYTEWKRYHGEKGFFSVHDSGRVLYDVEDTSDDYQVVYWALTSIIVHYVPRDITWLPSHIDELQTFWNEVLEHRKNGTTPQQAIKQTTQLDI